MAAAPMQKTQAPGYYRMMVGQYEVTALCDGMVELDAGLLKNISETDIHDLLARALVDNPHKIPAPANAYLINMGSKLVLVDAGGGKTFPGLGHLGENLAAAGYKPEQVDAVLITHLHPDHVGGLLSAEGKPAFPNAVVYLAKAENDCWLGEVEPKVPEMYKEHLAQARKLRGRLPSRISPLVPRPPSSCRRAHWALKCPALGCMRNRERFANQAARTFWTTY